MSTQENIAALSEKLGLDTASDEEKASFFEEIGGLILRSAYLRFCTAVGEQESQEFQTWMDTNQDDENLLEKAAERYPAFAKIVDEETKAAYEQIEALA